MAWQRVDRHVLARKGRAVTDGAADNPTDVKSSVQVIARAAAIMRLLAGAPDGLNFSELAARVGLPRTTVHRICRALEQEGLVGPDPASGRLQLGPELLRMAATSRRDLPTLIAPFLERLSRDLNETVDLGVLDGAHALYLAQYPAPSRVLMAMARVGGRIPAHCTSTGKSLLAYLPVDEVRRRLPAKLHLPARDVYVPRDDLLLELEEVRRTGLSFDREEHHAGICAVSVAITDVDGRVAAITVPMPATRFYEDQQKVVAALTATRDEIQARIDGETPF